MNHSPRKTCGVREALELLTVRLPEMIPEEIRTEEFCDEYQQMVNRVTLHMERDTEVEPGSWTLAGNKKTWYCGRCMAVLSIADNYCSACGQKVRWDVCRCLTKGRPLEKAL